MVDELGLDELASGGEDEGYVPCHDVAAAEPADETDSLAVFGEDAGYVPDGTGAAAEPDPEDDLFALVGRSSGFVAKPCEPCSCIDTFTRTGSALGISEFCGNPVWTPITGSFFGTTDGSHGVLAPSGAFGSSKWIVTAPIDSPTCETLWTVRIDSFSNVADLASAGTYMVMGDSHEVANVAQWALVSLDWETSFPSGVVRMVARLQFKTSVAGNFTEAIWNPFGTSDVRGLAMKVRLNVIPAAGADPPIAKAKVWDATGTEPGPWDATVSGWDSGVVGVPGTWTTPAALEVSADNGSAGTVIVLYDEIEVTIGCSA